MKKRTKNIGFTLAELLAVLVILSLIAMITIPAISDSIKKYKEKICVLQLGYVTEDAKIWAADNMEKLPTLTGETYDVDINTLMTYGYISSDLVNPKTGEAFSTDWVVRITKNNKKYEYTIYDTVADLTIDETSYCED